MKRILIRADDLGISEAVNYGIAKTVKEGIIRPIGVMPNMPWAKQGLDLIAGCDVCLGQHTNVCLGRPITDPKLLPSITNENGEFKSSRVYRSAKEDFVVLEEVILEIEAQYERFKELTGEEPHYFEAHAVYSPNLFRGLEIVAEHHNLDYLAFTLDEPVKFRNTMLHISMESDRPDYDPFESLKRCAMKEYSEDECGMFVCHPGWLDNYLLTHSSLTVNRAKETDMLCDPKTREWLLENGNELVTYDELA